ncbi:MAG: hypothetical protein EXS03_07840 [Phycisphaerales bacterium]|nr:hypothetical protein [Phycisphaerales bacterium]
MRQHLTHRRIEWSLATSACVLAAALVMLVLPPVDQRALAGDSIVPASNGIGVMTLPNGSGPSARPSESIYVLDNRTEMLLIYTVESAGASRSVALRYSESLPALFKAGRR